VKVIVGRNEEENAALAELAADRVRIEPVDVMGPTALVEGDPSAEELGLAASLCARYCDSADRSPVRLRIVSPGPERIIEAVPLDPADARIAAWRIAS